MGTNVIESGHRVNFTATNVVKGAGSLMGIFVASASGATLALADGVGTIVAAFTPIAGSYYPIPSRFSSDLTITVTGTLNATAFLQV